MLVNCVRLFRLDSLLQAYRCSSKWKTTSLYCISVVRQCMFSSGTYNDTSHRHYTVMQRLSASKTVQYPHNAPKVASWRPEIEIFFWGGAVPLSSTPVGRKTPLPTPYTYRRLRLMTHQTFVAGLLLHNFVAQQKLRVCHT